MVVVGGSELASRGPALHAGWGAAQRPPPSLHLTPTVPPPTHPGAVYSRGGLAEVGARLQPAHAEHVFGDSEGVVVRCRADDHVYSCVVRTTGGATYATKFSTRTGYNTQRLPWNTFRPLAQEEPPLVPGARWGVRGGGEVWRVKGAGARGRQARRHGRPRAGPRHRAPACPPLTPSPRSCLPAWSLPPALPARSRH